MADDIVIGKATYRRSEDGDWVEVISKACHTTVPDLVPFLDEIERLRAQVSQQRTGKLLLDLERLHEEKDGLVGRINWMIDTAYAWDSDGCFTFPDGYVWRKDSGARDQEPR